nr:odorant receptor 9 [Achelura yunnanensis]
MRIKKKIRAFHETYQIFFYAMTMGLIYPNPKTDRVKLLLIILVVLAVSPITAMLGYDMLRCWWRRDVANVIRHGTVLGPLLGILLKLFILYFKRDEAKDIIDEINSDYERYNHLPKAYQDIAEEELRNNKITEKWWAFCISLCAILFIGLTALFTIYSQLFDEEPKRQMIHELDPPVGDPESRYDSPYFELMFVYTCYGAVYYVLNFIGFDGFFGVAINHACLKIKMCCQAFSDAIKEGDAAEVERLIGAVVRDQCRTFSYVNTIQETFSVWLVVIFLATMVQICNCMYLIIEGYGLDVRYVIFTIGTIVHIYLPCWYSTKLKSVSLETSTLVYSSGWEQIPATRVRRLVLFVIARGQVPLQITALNIIKYDMELFVSIIQTSYSMFTLLKSS